MDAFLLLTHTSFSSNGEQLPHLLSTKPIDDLFDREEATYLSIAQWSSEKCNRTHRYMHTCILYLQTHAHICTHAYNICINIYACVCIYMHIKKFPNFTTIPFKTVILHNNALVPVFLEIVFHELRT